MMAEELVATCAVIALLAVCGLVAYGVGFAVAYLVIKR